MTTDEAIWQSAQNMMKSSKNLDKLWEAFDLIECEGGDPVLVIERNNSDSEDNGWIYPVWEAYYKVRQRPNVNLRDTGWITLAIQLTCDVGVEGDWQHGKRAKVLAGYAPFKNFDHAWGFDSEDPNSSGYVEECVTDEYRWIHSDEVSWFFAVPLDALTSTDDVEKCIVTPMRRLVRGENPDDVFGAIREKLCLPPQA
ncbi:hypothetical protein H5395_18405 [Paracoccus sp. MC1854]|uniref:hypothetical protein n=1 Tax=Paracoccus sp. MC1854 TaxID=2760306 RepID=UPI0015FF3FF1|nr:hypothetical protein [Paracoccus sp. MC1854]MBB1493396.1 hypothetical protein [Paracoccus sp. MC1854]